MENHFKALQGVTEEECYAGAKEKIPVTQPGRPQDIAKLAVFLCSEESEFVLGQTIVADGGTSDLMSLMTDFRTESTARFGIGYVPGV